MRPLKIISVIVALSMIGLIFVPINNVRAENILFADRYEISEEIKITNATNTHYYYDKPECADGIIGYTYKTPIGDEYLYYYDIINGIEYNTTYYTFYIVPSLQIDNNIICTPTYDGDWVYFIDNSTLMEFNYSTMWNYNYMGVYEDVIVSSNLYGGLYSVRVYYLVNDTIYTLFQDSGYKYNYAVINDKYIVAVKNEYPNPPDLMDNISWYDRETGMIYSTNYETIVGHDIYYSHLMIWDNYVVGVEYIDFDRRIGLWNLDNIDGNGNPEYTVISEEFDAYFKPDISQNLVIFDADIGGVNDWSGIYIYDIETEETLNLTFSNMIDTWAYSPTIWIGDDGYGYVSYVIYNETTATSDIYMRYINDTYLIGGEQTIFTVLEIVIISLIPIVVVIVVIRKIAEKLKIKPEVKK